MIAWLRRLFRRPIPPKILLKGRPLNSQGLYELANVFAELAHRMDRGELASEGEGGMTIRKIDSGMIVEGRFFISFGKSNHES